MTRVPEGSDNNYGQRDMVTRRAPGTILREMVNAGLVLVYDCPCRAEGRLTEVAAEVFVLRYGHDSDCPVLAGQGAA